MRKALLVSAMFGAVLATTAYAGHNSYEVQTPSSSSESDPARTAGSGAHGWMAGTLESSVAVFPDLRTPSSVNESGPALIAESSEEMPFGVGGTFSGAGGAVAGGGMSNPTTPSSSNESGPAEIQQ